MIDLTRRTAIGAAVGTTVGGAALAAMPAPLSAHGPVKKTAIGAVGRLNSWLADAPLFDRENAAKVLAEAGLDALLISEPTSIYHLTAIAPVTDTMFPRPFAAFALLLADQREPVRLLLNDFTYYYLASDERPGSWLETRLYSSPAPAENGYIGIPKANPATTLRAGPDAVLTVDEKRRRDEVAAMVPTMAASAEIGLVQMLRDTGLAGRRVGIDSFVAREYASRAELGIEFSEAARPMGLIRRIKSPIEIELMAHAATTNAKAAMMAAKAVRSGAEMSDLRTAYFAEAAALGGTSKFMAIDRATSVRYNRQLGDGQAFLIDGVAAFSGYHGDFGRTVFLGEPDRKMAAVVSEIERAWRAIRAKMIVGNTYADLLAAGDDAMRRSSLDILVRFNVHSVGLWHSDDPSGQSPEQWLGTTLAPGMVLSVDCPLFDEGIGGSAHYEDLTLITPNGPIALNPEYPSALLV